MKYKNAIPITSKSCTAWLIELPNKTQILELWCEGTKIEDVAKSGTTPKGSIIQRIDVGAFEIKTIESFSSDSRKVDTDLNILL